ncbi:MAG: RHS repeat-associated core domain-containing protein [Gemmatimonadetes bacterium]|nr:RHS repeat-associated core domain-containing protein [Gemmatimonadota bacterium]
MAGGRTAWWPGTGTTCWAGGSRGGCTGRRCRGGGAGDALPLPGRAGGGGDRRGGAFKWKYTWGPGTDNLVGLQDSTGTQFYVVQDQLGSVRGLVRRDGTWIMSQRFTPYGQLLARDSVAGHQWPKGLHVGWTGRETDPETGLSFHRARYYSPELRRWTEEDPIGYGGGGNLYAYGGGAVLEGRDPSGLIEDLRGGGGLGLAESFRPFTLDPTASSMLDQIPLPDGGAAARKAERENRKAQEGATGPESDVPELGDQYMTQPDAKTGEDFTKHGTLDFATTSFVHVRDLDVAESERQGRFVFFFTLDADAYTMTAKKGNVLTKEYQDRYGPGVVGYNGFLHSRAEGWTVRVEGLVQRATGLGIWTVAESRP